MLLKVGYLYTIYLLSMFHEIETYIIQSWDVKSKDEQKVFIEISRNTGGYKVSVNFDRQCGSFSSIINEYFKDENYEDPLVDSLKATKLGPDEIIIQLEGTSLQSYVAKTSDYCKDYYAFFQLPKSGKYRLKVFRLRTNYMALREIDEFPKINYDLFLDDYISMFLEKHIPRPCSRKAPTNGFWVTEAQNMNSQLYPIYRSDCDGDGMLPNLTTYFKIDRDIATRKCVKDVHLHWENREDCLYRYRLGSTSSNDDESMNDDGGKTLSVSFNYDKNVTSSDAMFIEKSILFIGDSHMRGFADLFLRKVCQFRKTETAVYKQVGPFKMQTHILSADPSKCTHTVVSAGNKECEPYHIGCESLTVSYLANMLCENGTSKYVEGYDYVIMNCGHHPAAAEHFSYKKYETDVNIFISEIMRHRKSRLFWLENTAPPLRQDHWVVVKKDWRTYHRLLVFNYLALREANKLNVSLTFLPAFQSTLALFDKNCDCAHYPISAKLPQMLGLLNSLRLFTF